jgi:hypothetical protein
VVSVGGKNASLGEMVRKLGIPGIKVPTRAVEQVRPIVAEGLLDMEPVEITRARVWEFKLEEPLSLDRVLIKSR